MEKLLLLIRVLHSSTGLVMKTEFRGNNLRRWQSERKNGYREQTTGEEQYNKFDFGLGLFILLRKLSLFYSFSSSHINGASESASVWAIHVSVNFSTLSANMPSGKAQNDPYSIRVPVLASRNDVIALLMRKSASKSLKSSL